MSFIRDVLAQKRLCIDVVLWVGRSIGRSFEVGVGFVGFEKLIGDHVAEMILFLTLDKSRTRRPNVFDDLEHVHTVLQFDLGRRSGEEGEGKKEWGRRSGEEEVVKRRGREEEFRVFLSIYIV